MSVSPCRPEGMRALRPEVASAHTDVLHGAKDMSMFMDQVEDTEIFVREVQRNGLLKASMFCLFEY